MGFFAPTPKVAGYEWEKVRSRLLSRGLSSRDVEDVEALVKKFGRGVDRGEIREIANHLRRHRGGHDLTDEQISKVEDALADEL